jgi:arylsulfatase A-like enzyme
LTVVAERPNFLFIITDQHRADHLGCYGNPFVRTPNIDGLAAEGVSFDDFHVASPICMPNRATLMTGRMPSVHGVRHNGIPLSLAATTFTDRLRDAGYRTSMIGKSHLQNMTGEATKLSPLAYDPTSGKSDVSIPAERPAPGRYDQELGGKWRDDPAHEVELPYYGFDSVEFANDHGDQVEGHYTRWLRRKRNDGDDLRGPKNALPGDSAAPQAWRTKLPEELYPTAYIEERAVARLKEFAADRQRPFFLKCSFPDPHHPFTPPGRYWGMYDPAKVELPASWNFDRRRAPPHLQWLLDQRDAGKAVKHTPALFACTEAEARAAIALSYGMITMIDDAIGRILAQLRALDLDRNTVVIFTSDHGDFMGDHQLLLKGPLHYPSITRVAFIWRDPQRPATGRRAALASTLDIARTVLDRADVPAFAGIQGRSLLPPIQGQAADWRNALLLEEEGQRVYLGFTNRVRLRTLLTERHRLSVYDGVAWGEFYDRRADPNETQNLWDDANHRQLRDDLNQRLLRLMIEHSDTSPYPTALA